MSFGVAGISVGELAFLVSPFEDTLVLGTAGKYLRMSFWPCVTFALGLRYKSMVVWDWPALEGGSC